MPLDLGKARSFQRFDQFARAVLGQVEGTLDLARAQGSEPCEQGVEQGRARIRAQVCKGGGHVVMARPGLFNQPCEPLRARFERLGDQNAAFARP